MVEIIANFYSFKRFNIMALATILTKFILMRIFMATGTIWILNSPELLEFFTVNCLSFMTFQTLNIYVFAC